MTTLPDGGRHFGALRLRRLRTAAHRPAMRAVGVAFALALALALGRGPTAFALTAAIALTTIGLTRFALRSVAWARLSRFVVVLALLGACLAIVRLGGGRADAALAPLCVAPVVVLYRDAALVAVTTSGALALVLATPGAGPLDTTLRLLAVVAEGAAFFSIARRSAARVRRAAAAAALERHALVDALAGSREELRLSQVDARERADAQASEGRVVAARAAFLTQLSHELRTPLNAVVGYLELLGTTALDPAQADHLAGARTSAHHVIELVHDVLDHAKIEGGKLELLERPFELRTVFGDVRTVMEAAARAKGLVLRIEIAEDVPRWLEGDPLRVRQVLLNLLTNAIKFTERGEVRVRARRAEPGPGIRIDVSDDGIGIPASASERVFDPYRQASAGIAQRHGGTGLGLSISRQLARAMGGDLTFDSVVGVGTTFHFVAPLPSADAPRSLPVAHPASKTRLRVLVADDNATNRLVTARMVEVLGHEVASASNGREAVERCTSGTFDVVLMDVEMPELDGLAATGRLRAAGNAVPILGFTAHESKEQIDACVAAGMNGVLHKPLELAPLRAALEEAASRAWSARPSLPPLAAPSGGWVELTSLRARVGEDAAVQARVLDAVARESQRLRSELASVMDRRDVSEFRRLAHALATCLENVGATALVGALRELEAVAAAGNADRAAVLTPRILTALAALDAELTHETAVSPRAA